MSLKVEWVDRGREPQCQPNPQYPDGIDVDISLGAERTCSAPLPYPARRCGIYIVRCDVCGTSAGITTAGRPDDPRSVKLACKNDDARPDQLVRQTEALVKLIEPMLAGQGPDVQGATLCDLTATWLAGHHPDLRHAMLTNFIQTVARLTPTNEQRLFGDGGFPQGGLQ